MKRGDMSHYLFHGVRMPNEHDYLEKERDLYYPLLEGNELSNEFDVLKNIIEEGGLRGSLSYRKGKPTVYGGIDVICFTEMPLINLLEYVEIRNDRSKISEYGIAILKKDAFKFGARPVISGLSISEEEFIWEDSKNRVISEGLLPRNEQYRYVKLTTDIDWTHEREWRMKVDRNRALKEELFIKSLNGIYPTEYVNGVNIFCSEYFTKCIIIIKTEEEAKEIFDIVHRQLDSGYCIGGGEFTTNIEYLILDKAKALMQEDVSYSNIESLPDTVYYKHAFKELCIREKEKVDNALKKCFDKALIFANDFINNPTHELDESGAGYKDTAGYTYVGTYNSKHSIVRYLREKNMITNTNNFYSICNVMNKAPFKQGLCYHQYIAEKQAEYLNNELEVDIFTTYSILD